MQSGSKEAQAMKQLLALSEQPYKRVLVGMEWLDVSGWRKVRPRALYDLTATPPGHSRRRILARGGGIGICSNRTRSYLNPVTSRHIDTSSYMSGSLDENFNYTYRVPANLSNSSNGSLGPLPPTPPSTAQQQQHRSLLSTMYLDPATAYHTTAHMDIDSRLVLARIVAMQLKPELFVEQLLIESRLRSMNIENLQQLNLEGVGVDPKSIHQLDKGAWLRAVKSKSTSTLGTLQTNTHRKLQRRKNMFRHPALDWCTLNPATEDVLGRQSHFTSEGKVYVGMDTTQPQVTKYRLPQLQQGKPQDPLMAMRSPHGPLDRGGGAMRSQQQHEASQVMRSQYRGAMGGAGGQEKGFGHSLHIPVVEPTLAPEGAGLGPRLADFGGLDQYWKQNTVKHISKLKSLGWQ